VSGRSRQSQRTTPKFSDSQSRGIKIPLPYLPCRSAAGIDLAIHEGECIAVLGQNGSGKTTLAKHFNGLLKPTSGRLLVQNKPTTEYNHRQLARWVGYVFQNPDHQIFARTVAEEVGFGLKMQGEISKMIEKRVAEALEVVGYRDMSRKYPLL